MKNNLPTFRRILTGHDENKKAIVTSAETPSRTFLIGGDEGAVFYEVWNTQQTPAVIDNKAGEPEENGLVLGPPKTGTRIRVIDFPPEGDAIRNLTKEEAAEHFKAMNGEESSKAGKGAPHPLMHRTQTIDYAIVLDGEITMVLDQDETVIKAGDIIIQRGTNHAWANRSGKYCRVAFILIDGEFDPSLR